MVCTSRSKEESICTGKSILGLAAEEPAPPRRLIPLVNIATVVFQITIPSIVSFIVIFSVVVPVIWSLDITNLPVRERAVVRPPVASIPVIFVCTFVGEALSKGYVRSGASCGNPPPPPPEGIRELRLIVIYSPQFDTPSDVSVIDILLPVLKSMLVSAIPEYVMVSPPPALTRGVNVLYSSGKLIMIV